MYDRVKLYLIKPSKYDDEGYVIRYWKGVLPSNTLACLSGLTEDVKERKALGPNIKWDVRCLDETVQRIKVDQIARSCKGRNTKAIICLVGVQSNQFPRAYDLATAFRRHGLTVMIGGFHVSGIIATLPNLSPELERLVAMGVNLVAGEVEGRWETILRDAMNDQLKPVYNFISQPPDLSIAPFPRFPKNLINRYAVKYFATLDCGRGCPFQCTFCTVINVQGRQMRYRAVDCIMNMIRENYRTDHIKNYFFTDDNFCRNKNWEAILDGLINLREKENIKVEFMVQVDTRSHEIPNFIEKAKRAGCLQAFIGIESINAQNLLAAGKRQNKIDEFKGLIKAYHEVGITTHLAYIIGFPFDTEKSVKLDIKHLQEFGAQQASFFMLTPLPGSQDYCDFLKDHRFCDADLNNFDSFHETFAHKNMKRGTWAKTYEYAWQTFYGYENTKKILREASAAQYWGVFMNFLWYKNAVQVEKGHPMLHGFLRLKSRYERRFDYPMESRFEFFKRRVREVWDTIQGCIKLTFEMEEIWLATRKRSQVEEKFIVELEGFKKRFKEWRELKISELQALYKKTIEKHAATIKHRNPIKLVPSRLELFMKKLNIFSDKLTSSRKPMNRFWREVRIKMKRGQIHRIHYPKIIIVAVREISLFGRFLLAILKRALFQ